MASSHLTARRLREVLHYCPETGVFTWRVRIALYIKVGDVAGMLDHYGYVLIGVDGKKYGAQRLAFFYMTGEWPPHDIDHKNEIRHDNRWDNLRPATRGENNQNRHIANRNSKSGILGVSWAKSRQKWEVRLTVAGKGVYFGYFDTAEEGHAAYLEAKRRFHPYGPI